LGREKSWTIEDVVLVKGGGAEEVGAGHHRELRCSGAVEGRKPYRTTHTHTD